MVHISKTMKQLVARFATGLGAAGLICGFMAAPAEAHHGGFGRSFGRGLGFGMGSGLGYGIVNRGFGGFMGGGMPFGGMPFGGYDGYGMGGYGPGYAGGYAAPVAMPSYGPQPVQNTNVVVVQQPAAPAEPPGYPYPVPGYTHYQPGQGYVAQGTTYVQGYGYVPTPPQPITP